MVLSQCPVCKTSPLFTAKSPLVLPPPPKSKTGNEDDASCISSVASGIVLLIPTSPACVMRTLSVSVPLALANILNGTLPENYSIKHWHNEQEYGEYQVHDEANRSPNGACYVHPTGANTLIEVVDVEAEKMRIKILLQDHTEVNIYASNAMRLFGYQCN